MNIHLDPEEQDLIDSIERGEWQSVPNLPQEIERYQRYAQLHYKSLTPHPQEDPC